MEYRVNNDRIEEVSKVFRVLGINGVKAFEEHDVQFQAVKQIVEKCYQVAHYLLYLNSIVSYNLMYPGERFWLLFARYVSERCTNVGSFREAVDLVVSFTLKHNRILANQKIDRLVRISMCRGIEVLIDEYRFELINTRTAECLQSRADLKTIVFSVKMLYYVLRARGYDAILPNTIPIPVDRRVALITYLSGLIDIAGRVGVTTSELLRISKTIREVWNRISLLSSIPPLHIDSVLWYLGKYGYNLSTRSSILSAIDKYLVSSLGEETVRRLVNELFYRLPP